MSNYIDEIVKDIEDNPTSYTDYDGFGVQKGNVCVHGYGNSKLLSIIHVKINGKDMPTTYVDRWRLEAAIGKWYRSVGLQTLKTLPQY